MANIWIALAGFPVMVASILYITKWRTDKRVSNWWLPSTPKWGSIGLIIAILLELVSLAI